MSNEIKSCFKSYVAFMKSSHLKNLDTTCLEEIPFMTSSQIGSELDLIHMQYILSSPFSVSKMAPAWVSYEHLRRMIDTEDINKKCIQLEINIRNLLEENNLLREEIAELKSKLPQIESDPVPEETIPTPDISSPEKSRNWFFH